MSHVPANRAPLLARYEIVIPSNFWAVSGGDSESVTLTKKYDAPREVGVPDIFPRRPSLSPRGSVPEVMAQAYGEAPPLAVREVE